MSELIIPAGAKVNYRPYGSATTQALMYELQQRGIVAELQGQILVPDTEFMTEEVHQALRIEQFKAMSQQMGLQILQSGWALSAIGQQPNVMDPERAEEVLMLRVMVLRHPSLLPTSEIPKSDFTPAT